MSKYDYVIFDFDGTVVDTGEGIIVSLQYAFEQMGDEVPSKDDLRRFIGPPLFYSFTEFYSISEDRVEEYIKKYRERYTVKGIYECELYKGITELIATLRSRGIKVGVASSKPEKLIYDVAGFLGITDCFDAIVGVPMDYAGHSTKTGLILRAMDKLGAEDKSRVLMVGDRCFDIDGASGAGVDCCAVLWGYGSEKEFIDHAATFIVRDPGEILELI
ncbi:MAG: HAD hydrolase-like protein [Oscillospiraceae bacterium]|nr:HAD hydrolase-like protein [Oscillospiraceae bacterium]MDD6147078.1 HAD hydrolase-like protein [Oscillospiraceae bacterium]